MAMSFIAQVTDVADVVEAVRELFARLGLSDLDTFVIWR